MSKGSNFKETIKFAGAYISVCIGSGFATGQEIMQFFSAHGLMSILSNIISMIILAYCGSTLLETGNTVKLKSSGDIFTYLCGNWIGKFCKIFMPIFFFCNFVVMVSGAGASMNQYYGINKDIGSLILTILAITSVLLGLNKVIDILGNIGPVIAIISVGVGIITISKNYETFSSANQIISNLNVTKAGNNWLMTSVLYSGLNLVVATPFLVGVGSTAKNKQSCIWGGILGGVVFMIAAMALNLGIMSDIQNIYMKQIPTLYMADQIAPMLGIAFSAMLIAGIYTTAVPLLWSTCTSFAEEKTSKFTITVIACSVLGFVGARFPFAMLVNFIYPLSGLFGLIIIVSILKKRIEIKHMKAKDCVKENAC